MGMKGYKAFRHGFYCEVDGNRKQYQENSIAEDTGADSCCEKGVMHFCETPFDTLNYYPLIDDEGNFSEFAEVEALDEVFKKEDKRATKRLRIGAKLSFKDFIKAGIDVLIETTKPGAFKKAACDDNGGNSAQIGSSGDYAKIGSSGYSAQIGSSGDSAKITATGKDSVVAAIGVNSRIRAALGCWITLAEYGEWNGRYYPVLCVKSAQIDGTTLKPDTWYKLENGEFVEVAE